MKEDTYRRVGAMEGLAFHSLKQLITWNDDFKVDHPNIDRQHQCIFKLAVEAAELSRDRADDEKLRTLFDEFSSVLQGHCRYEESQLAEMRYPNLDEHRAEHDAILSELDFIRQRMAKKREGWASQEAALVIVNFMLGVTVGHILHSDVDYARHMREGLGSGERLCSAS